MKISVKECADILRKKDNILILTHANPDGDTLGSGFALCRALMKIGKICAVINADDIPKKYNYLFDDIVEIKFKPDYVVAVDVATVKLLGGLEEQYKIDMCIDHHSTNTEYANLLLLEDAPAACQIMYEVVLALGVEVDKKIADCLYTGLTTDTGCFRYDSTTAQTYRVAADLIDAGADNGRINRIMFETKSKTYARLERLAIESMRFYEHERVAVITVTQEMFQLTGSNAQETEGLAPLTRQIEGVEIGITIQERPDGTCKASIRTFESVNAGDIVVAGTAVGKIRAMSDYHGKPIETAGPSVPVEIMGLDSAPMSGDEFNAVSDEKLARALVEQRKAKAKEEEFKLFQKVTLDTLFDTISEGEMKELNIIVKADVQGSVEAVKQSLLKIENDEVNVKIVHGAVGAVSESDVMLAEASKAIIVAFNTGVDQIAADNAKRDGVEIKQYDIIYDAIEDIERAMRGMRAPKYRDVDTGEVEVREVYKISSAGTIAGSLVTSGTIKRDGKVRVIRNGKQIADVKLANLKRFKDEVKEVSSGYECGISLDGWDDIQSGDILQAYIVEEYRD